MRIEPTTNKPQPTFEGKNTVIQYIKPTSYGRCIHGHSVRGFDYDVYVATDNHTGSVVHKLYYITKDNKWIKSVLKFFSGDKVYKEVKSENWL